MRVGNVEINLEREVLCPCCGEEMVVDLPISVTPGGDCPGPDNIDYGAACQIERWTCCTCGEFDGFPENYTQERMAEIMDKANEHLLTDADKFIIEVEGPGGLL